MGRSLVISTLRRFYRTPVLAQQYLKPLQPSTAVQPSTKMSYVAVERGTSNTEAYRIYFKKDDKFVSPLHDIPCFADEEKKTVNMVVEIPRWTNAKMEINLKEPLNPIKQDIKKGKLRFVANCFPHHGYIWNYGAIPQTWENPEVLDSRTGQKGDNDPIDCMEIGYRVAKRGEVIQAKVLGCIALIDEGETDWKVITIDVNDPLAETMNDITDVEKFMPGLLKATIEWLRIYKIPDGKPENQFGLGGEFKNRSFALGILSETHKHWLELIKSTEIGQTISRSNTTLTDSAHIVASDAAETIVAQNEPHAVGQPPEDIVGKWHFLHLK